MLIINSGSFRLLCKTGILLVLCKIMADYEVLNINMKLRWYGTPWDLYVDNSTSLSIFDHKI